MNISIKAVETEFNQGMLIFVTQVYYFVNSTQEKAKVTAKVTCDNIHIIVVYKIRYSQISCSVFFKVLVALSYMYYIFTLCIYNIL